MSGAAVIDIYQQFKQFDFNRLIDALRENYQNSFTAPGRMFIWQTLQLQALEDQPQVIWFRDGLQNIGGAAFAATMNNIAQQSAQIRTSIAAEPNPETVTALSIKLEKIVTLVYRIRTLLNQSNAVNFNLLQNSIIDCMAFSREHNEVLRQLVDDDSQTILLCIGAGDNEMQALPRFALHEARAGRTVSIYNLDAEKIPLTLPDELQDRVRLHLNELPIFFPSVECQLTSSVDFRSDSINFNRTLFSMRRYVSRSEVKIDRVLAQIVASYVNVLQLKKHDNPDLRVKILFCCDTWLDPYIKDLFTKLQAIFTSDRDLHLIHTYQRESPAAVFRRSNVLPSGHTQAILTAFRARYEGASLREDATFVTPETHNPTTGDVWPSLDHVHIVNDIDLGREQPAAAGDDTAWPTCVLS